jgi:SAM-dependent methyltransferase
MDGQFYDKVAKKFGDYHSESSYISEYPDEDPEVIFKNELLNLSGEDINALDLGCADGRFTLDVASHFKHITAVDLSEGMLKAAEKYKKIKKVTNVVFKKMDATHTDFPDGSFDVIWSRRGPTPLDEIYRLLKKGGNFIEIDIGENDAKALKEAFGRGQGYGDWDTSHISLLSNDARTVGFETTYMKNVRYQEYYVSMKDLDLFLQGVPIFEDYDSVTDKARLEKYAGDFTRNKGILLERHRIVCILHKS